MSDLVERVARAIACGLEMDGVRIDDYRRNHLARAAIEAMRWQDGWDEGLAIAAGRVVGIDAVMAAEVHDAWINAALKEETP